MNKKAIVIYLDNNDKLKEEFTWLYKTWVLNDLFLEYDLLIYGPKEVLNDIPENKNIIFKIMNPIYLTDTFWNNYKFVNSFSMFNDKLERKWLVEKYDYILKTDCDVFLTKNLIGLNPDKLHIGFGGYMAEKSEVVSNKLLEYSKKLKLSYKDINHIGSSIFGKTELVTNIVYAQYILTKIILKDFGNNVGEWPGWYKGVSSMYGIHLAVNNFCLLSNINMYSLDEMCVDKPILKNTYHIHAWHTPNYFSKHDWFKGKYQKYISNKIPDKISEYCHWIVSNSLEEILKVKDDNSNNAIIS